ncbi:MAG: O-antigen ligase family protein [Glaciimonas sp.]|nr:O-antigen ligase family protein [Glaciimonas sp.]
MKNTASIPATDGMIFLPKPGFINRWGAVPFLCWIAVVGMPLQRSLEVSQPVWMADVYASTLAATSNTSSLQSIPFVLFMAGIYLCAGLLVLGKPKTAFSILRRQWPLLLLILFVVASMLWSPNKEKVLMNVVHNLGGLLVTMAAALRYRATPWLLPKHIGYVLGFNIVVHLASILLLPSFAIEWDGRWRGLTGQANELGAIAFCTFWANAAVLIGTRKDKYHLHLVLAGCAAAAMLGANSMTSIISSICALAMIYVVAGTNSRYRIGERLFIGGFGMIVLVAAVGVMFLGNAMDIGKLLGLAGRSGDFTGRTEIWLEAIKAIVGRPWVGWGFDDNAYLIKTTGMPYTTYHNGYLDLMARGGIIALGLFFLLLGNWLLQVTNRTRVGSDIVPFAIPFIGSMLIYNLTEATLVAPRDQMWLILLVILFLGGCRKSPQMRIAHFRNVRMHPVPSEATGFESSNYPYPGQL